MKRRKEGSKKEEATHRRMAILWVQSQKCERDHILALIGNYNVALDEGKVTFFSPDIQFLDRVVGTIGWHSR